jgi:hypothetical protein
MLITIFLLLMTIFVAVQLPAVQTWLGHRLAGYLSKEWNTVVKIGSVDIDIWSTLNINEVYIEDHRGDTLGYIRSLAVNTYTFDRHTGNVVVKDIELQDPYFNLVRPQGEKYLNYKFLVDYFSSPEDSTQSDGEIVLNHVKLNNGRFNYINENRPVKEYYGIDWNHFMLKGIELDVSQFYMIGDSISARISHMAAHEKTGFSLLELSNDFTMSDGDIHMNNADLRTSHSEIQGDLNFVFNSIDDIDYFEEKVKMNHKFTHAVILMDELAYFSYELKGFNQLVTLSGHVRGTVANLKGRDIEISLNKNTRFRGNFEMEGLPEIDQTFITMDIKELTSNKHELDQIQLPPFDSLHYVKTPNNFSTLGQITYKGNFTGFISDFVSYGAISTAIGKVRTDISLKEDASINDYRYTGGLSMEQFDLGKFYSSQMVGPISADLNVQGKGLELTKVDASFSGDIHGLVLNDYNFTNINADGTFRHKAFSGDFTIDDPNVNMNFTGSIDFTKTLPLLYFDSQIFHLNLKAIHILPEYDYSSVSGNVSVKSEGFEFDKFVGEIILDEITYCALDRDYEISHLSLTSERIGEPTITLNSSVAFAEIRGEFDLREIGSSMTEIASKIIPSFHPPVRKHRTQNFVLDLNILDFTQISEVFLPDLKIAPNTIVKMVVDEPGSYFETVIVSDEIIFQDNKITSLILDIRRPDESFYITATSDQLDIGESLRFPSLAIDARTESDTVYTAVVWGSPQHTHSGDINGKLTVRDFNRYDFTFGKSSLTVKDELWTFKELGMISMDSSDFAVKNFEIHNGLQVVRSNGLVNRNPLSNLLIELENFNLANVNAFVGSETKFYGTVNGNANIRDVYNEMIFTNNTQLSSFRINEYDIGDLDVISIWDQTLKQLRIDGSLKKNLESDNPLTRYTPISFAGYYRPKSTESPLDLVATIDQLDLSFINAFMSPGILDIAGFASGTMAITGTPDAPQMRADALLKDASVFIHYLNTKYYIEEKIGVYPDMFTFDHIRVHDEEGKYGYLTGTMLHNNFGDWNFDITVDMEEPMLAMNTNEELNSLYYGKAYTTGTVNIYGYEDKLEFDLVMKSEKGTELSMPMGNSGEQSFESFIRFVNPNDTIEEEPINLSGIKMNFQLEITPEAQFQIIFDESVGDIMKGSGKGHINMEINNLSSFSMYGQVELVRGDYLFTLKNLINKEFTINPGGTIAWYGDPFGGEMDIDAIYKVSASLYDLIPDPAYQSGQRVPVNLVMHLNDKIFNPLIDFGIDLPTVDQVTRSRVDAIISTEQERNRQAFALLVLRRFVSPPNVTSDHNSTNAIAANSTEFLSSQISNWLSQISDDFNLGFNYSPGDDISNEEIALALSTQLFNERLSLSSNLGVSRNTAGAAGAQNTTNLIGDVRIEYKITPEGKIRLVVYNESNDFRRADTQQAPYTQGVGVIYRQDFDTFEEFFDGFRDLVKAKKTPEGS